MNWLTLSVVFTVIICITSSETEITSELRKCVQCLCHARTGCYRRQNCASYSINMTYWQNAGRPVVDSSDDPNSSQSFTKCMHNEECIITTIINYTNRNQNDCNCDGQFDCKDRLAIHLFGAEKCFSPNFGTIYATRFNQCAKGMGIDEMLSQEGGSDCTPEPL